MGRAKFSAQNTVPGDAYVTDTHKFADLVFEACIKLPKKWGPYILVPLFHDADRIDTDVTKANRIYMNDKALPPEQLRKNLEERMAYLDDAIRTFDSFDRHFDRMMAQMDLLDTDFRQMRGLIKEIVAKTEPEKKISVEIHGTDNFFSYTADMDGERVTIHFTRKKKDAILAAEALSKERIGDRRSRDQKYYKSMVEKGASPGALNTS